MGRQVVGATPQPLMSGNLEEWIVPERYREGRSGVATYMHPELLRGLRRQDPDAMLAELVQVGFEVGTPEWEPMARYCGTAVRDTRTQGYAELTTGE